MKKAFISGISGQDASYLAELLLEKGYEVHGNIKWDSVIATERINHLMHPKELIKVYNADLTDTSRLTQLITQIKPDEFYNLASMSHVRVSFDMPEYTGNVTGLGVCRMLEILRNYLPETKFYQASSSEMFGCSPPPQNEDTVFQPQSPYGCAKLYGYWLTKAYRKGYNMFACNGILFNHESERRGETFVTRKIVQGAVRIKKGIDKKIKLGNLEAKRDWGHSRDYVEAMYRIMQHTEPDDFVVATNEYYSVREFAEKVFEKLGLNFYDYLEIDKRLFRANEVPELRGDASKIKRVLGWEPKVGFDELISLMLESELKKS